MSTFFNLINEFQNLGCKNEARIAYTCRVFGDLKDVVKIPNLDKFYDCDFDVIFIQGGSQKGPSIYLPISSCENIDFKMIELIQERICEGGKKRLTICICDPDSTILYYNLTRGWKE